MKKVTFLVPEYVEDGFGVKMAILTAHIADDSPLVAQYKFQEALMNAVTEWVKTTADGRKIFKLYGLVSLQTLVPEQPFSHLFTTILAKHGIKDMKIDILEGDTDDCWRLRDVLIDRITLKE